MNDKADSNVNDLVDCFKFSLTSVATGSCDADRSENSRLLQYKNRNFALQHQEKRRLQRLQEQKDKRYESLMLTRHLADEDEGGGENAEERMDIATPWHMHGRRRPIVSDIYKDQLMLGEWLVEVPDDFNEQWFMVPCPAGTKQVLVVACKGKTRLFAKNGQLMKTFSSVLPGGCKGQQKNASTFTFIHALYDKNQNLLFALDVMAWNAVEMFNSDSEFRFYWLKSKFEEMPELARIAATNQIPILPLPFCCCSVGDMQEMLNAICGQFTEIDGLLFYHKLTLYTPGSTPLVGWLKPWMLPEMLGVPVPDQLKEQALDSINGERHANAESYIAAFDQQYHSKNRRGQRGYKKAATHNDMDIADLSASPVTDVSCDSTQ